MMTLSHQQWGKVLLFALNAVVGRHRLPLRLSNGLDRVRGFDPGRGDSNTHELVGRTNRPAHPLSEPRDGLRPGFSI